MEGLLCDSGLAWTVVRPPRLTDKPLSGGYRTAWCVEPTTSTRPGAFRGSSLPSQAPARPVRRLGGTSLAACTSGRAELRCSEAAAGRPAVFANLTSPLETGRVLPQAPGELHAELGAAQLAGNDPG
jgi:hypothetical protein